MGRRRGDWRGVALKRLDKLNGNHGDEFWIKYKDKCIIHSVLDGGMFSGR